MRSGKPVVAARALVPGKTIAECLLREDLDAGDRLHRAVPADQQAHRVRSELLIVLDMPSAPEGATWQRGTADDLLLRHAMRAHAASMPDWANLQCRFVYAVDQPCEYPQPPAIAAARARIAAEIADRPAFVLAMGHVAHATVGLDRDVSRSLGHLVDHRGARGNLLRIVPTYSARDIVKHPQRYFEFSEHLRRALELAATASDRPRELNRPPTYHTAALVSELREQIETNLIDGGEPISVVVVAELCGAATAVAFAWAPGCALVIPLVHADPHEVALARESVARVLATARPKVIHDANVAITSLELVEGFHIGGFAGDVVAAQHLLWEQLPAETNLEMLADLYGVDLSSHSDALADAAAKADLTLQVSAQQRQRMAHEDPDGRLVALTTSWIAPVQRYLARVRFGGFCVDADEIDRQLAELESIASSAERLLRDLAKNPELNVDAPAQIAAAVKALDSTCELGGDANTTEALAAICKKAGVQMDDAAAAVRQGKMPPLDNPLHVFAVARLVYVKTKSSGIDQLAGLKRMIRGDGRIHPELRIHGAVTGRLSAPSDSGVNLQALPHDERLREGGLSDFSVRDVVRASSPSRVLVQVDVKAAEIRCLAAYTQDPVLIRTLVDGLDPHCAVAAETFGDATYGDYLAAHEGQLSDRELAARLTTRRAQVKRVVFGAIYGSTDFGIAKQIFRTEKPSDEQVAEASGVRVRIHARLPSLAEFVEQTRREVNTLHYVVNLIGRRERFPQLAFDLPSEQRLRCHRQALNFKVQSLASDLLVGQLAELDPHLGDLDGLSILTVHDAGLFEISSSKIDQAAAFFEHWITARVAARYPWMPVPFSIDISVGETYSRLRAIDAFLSSRTEGPR